MRNITVAIALAIVCANCDRGQDAVTRADHATTPTSVAASSSLGGGPSEPPTSRPTAASPHAPRGGSSLANAASVGIPPAGSYAYDGNANGEEYSFTRVVERNDGASPQARITERRSETESRRTELRLDERGLVELSDTTTSQFGSTTCRWDRPLLLLPAIVEESKTWSAEARCDRRVAGDDDGEIVERVTGRVIRLERRELGGAEWSVAIIEATTARRSSGGVLGVRAYERVARTEILVEVGMTLRSEWTTTDDGGPVRATLELRTVPAR